MSSLSLSLDFQYFLFQVFVLIESLTAHFSPSIYGAFIELITYLGSLHLSCESEILDCPYLHNLVSVVPTSSTFGISIISKLGSVDLEVDLENNGDNSSVLMVSVQEMDIRYVHHCPSVHFFP